MKTSILLGAAVIAVSLAACSSPAENSAATAAPSASAAVSETQRDVELALRTGMELLPVTCENFEASRQSTAVEVGDWLSSEYPSIGSASMDEIRSSLEAVCADVPPPSADEIARAEESEVVGKLVGILEYQDNLADRCQTFRTWDKDVMALALIEAASDGGLIPADTGVDLGIEAFEVACS